MKHIKSISELDFSKKPMVDGIIDILLQVKDMDNRLEIAKNQIELFKKEGITFDYIEFLEKCGF